MGDQLLRDNYQIWQVYYPTNVPLLINRQEIAEAINKTIEHFDPSRTNPASKNITLIGHSMGGILIRLLVSDSGNTIIDALEQKYPQASDKINQMDPKFKSILRFKPLQGVTTAIFLAAPHQGTPVRRRKLGEIPGIFCQAAALNREQARRNDPDDIRSGRTERN